MFWGGVAYLAAAIALYGRLTRSPAAAALSLERALNELGDLLLLLVEPDRQKELDDRFAALLHTLHQMSYHQQFFARQTPDNQLHDMGSTLAQRFSYLITDHEWRAELDEKRIAMLRGLAGLLQDYEEEVDWDRVFAFYQTAGIKAPEEFQRQVQP